MRKLNTFLRPKLKIPQVVREFKRFRKLSLMGASYVIHSNVHTVSMK